MIYEQVDAQVWLTLAEAAKTLGCGEYDVRQLVARRRIRCFQIGSKSPIKFRPEWIAEYVETYSGVETPLTCEQCGKRDGEDRGYSNGNHKVIVEAQPHNSERQYIPSLRHLKQRMLCEICRSARLRKANNGNSDYSDYLPPPVNTAGQLKLKVCLLLTESPSKQVEDLWEAARDAAHKEHIHSDDAHRATQYALTLYRDFRQSQERAREEVAEKEQTTATAAQDSTVVEQDESDLEDETYHGKVTYFLRLKNTHLFYVGNARDDDKRFLEHVRVMLTWAAVFAEGYGFDKSQVDLERLVVINSDVEYSLHEFLSPVSLFPNCHKGWFKQTPALDQIIEHAIVNGRLPEPDQWGACFGVPESTGQPQVAVAA